MKSLLIVSFSPLHRDPRVLRQIKLFSENGYRVTTMGYGPQPAYSEQHIELPGSDSKSVFQKVINFATNRLLPTHKWYLSYPWHAEAVQWAQDHRNEFDVILTNDALAAPVGRASHKPWHADLHEFNLGQNSSLEWKISTRPLLRWATPLLTKADSTSTVAPGIADKYQELIGIAPFVVNNAPNYRPEFTPTDTGSVIRLLHMGVGDPERSLEMPLRAVIAANQHKPNSLTLDYYLVPGDSSYIERLRQMAAAPGSGVTVHDPVPYDQILPTMRQYDVGTAFYPPHNMNLKHSLPNKFFEAVQARTGFITGPSPEMGPYIHQYGFGTTTTDWTQESLNRTYAEITREQVDEWKKAAHEAAPKLGAEQQDQKWLEAVDKLSAAKGTTK